MTVMLRLNGRPSGTRVLTVNASGDTKVAFDPVAIPVGLIRGEVTIDADSLAADDTARFTLTSNDEVRVLLVAPDDAERDETLYIERALAVGRAPSVRLQRVRPSAIDADALRDGVAARLTVVQDVDARFTQGHARRAAVACGADDRAVGRGDDGLARRCGKQPALARRAGERRRGTARGVEHEPLHEGQIRRLEREVAIAGVERHAELDHAAGSLGALDDRRRAVVEPRDDLAAVRRLEAGVAQEARRDERGRRLSEGREQRMVDAHVAQRAAAVVGAFGERLDGCREQRGRGRASREAAASELHESPAA
jgi:hypothetical protein